MSRRTRSIFQWILAGSLMGLAALVLVVCAQDYGTVRGYLDQFSGDGSADPYTPELHRSVKRICQLAGVLCIATGGLIFQVSESFWKKIVSRMELRSRFHSTCRMIRVVSRSDLRWMLALMLLAFGLRLPYLFDPIRYDEAQTYLSYARMPWFVGLSLYDAPNNHVLHTLLVHFSVELFGNAEWSIRLPAFAAGGILVPLTFLTGRVAIGRQGGLAAALIVAVSSPLIEYSVLGRGYTLVCCFTMLSLLWAWRILRCSKGLEWPLLTLSTALGMWTVPVMVYAILLIWGWLFLAGLSTSRLAKRRLPFLRAFGASALGSVGITLLLYMPIFVVSGMSSLMRAGIDRSATDEKFFWTFLRGIEETGDLLLRDWPILCLLVVAGLFVIGITDRMRTLVTRFGIEMILSAFALLLTIWVPGVIPPPRAMLFLIPIGGLLVGQGVDSLSRRSESLGINWIVRVVGALCLISAVLTQLQSNSIRRSTETGVCPEAQSIAAFLGTEIEQRGNEDLRCVVVSPVSAPIVYYGTRLGLPEKIFERPDVISHCPIIVVVSMLHGQSVDDVLDQLDLGTIRDLGQFELFKRMETVALYRLERKVNDF